MTATAFSVIDEILDRIADCRRAIPEGMAPLADTYLEGAWGAVALAREALRDSITRDRGTRWTARISMGDVVQSGDFRTPLSVSEGGTGDPRPAMPDLGASLMRSEEVLSLAADPAYAALLASALGEHRWLHVASGRGWTCARGAAAVLVRALGNGREFPRIGHVELHGTVDRRVAENLAAMGWRRITAPGLPADSRGRADAARLD